MRLASYSVSAGTKDIYNRLVIIERELRGALPDNVDYLVIEKPFVYKS